MTETKPSPLYKIKCPYCQNDLHRDFRIAADQQDAQDMPTLCQCGANRIIVEQVPPEVIEPGTRVISSVSLKTRRG